MTTDTQEPTPGTREHFLRVTQLQRWGTIQEDVELCRAQGYFTPQFYAKARYGLQRPLFSEDDGEVGGEGEA
jgi:hypothetical protein